MTQKTRPRPRKRPAVCGIPHARTDRRAWRSKATPTATCGGRRSRRHPRRPTPRRAWSGAARSRPSSCTKTSIPRKRSTTRWCASCTISPSLSPSRATTLKWHRQTPARCSASFSSTTTSPRSCSSPSRSARRGPRAGPHRSSARRSASHLSLRRVRRRPARAVHLRQSRSAVRRSAVRALRRRPHRRSGLCRWRARS